MESKLNKQKNDNDKSSVSNSNNNNIGQSCYGSIFCKRNLIGYSNHPPNPKWPYNAKVALNFIIHYEEGGEICTLHGDKDSEITDDYCDGSDLPDTCNQMKTRKKKKTTKMPTTQQQQQKQQEAAAASIQNNNFNNNEEKIKHPQEQQNQQYRDLNLESLYDYGSRVGFWRLYNLFVKKKQTPCTFAVVGMALQRNHAVSAELYRLGKQCWMKKQKLDTGSNATTSTTTSIDNETNNNPTKSVMYEISSNGYRSNVDYNNYTEELQREHIQKTIQIHKDLLGQHPPGIFISKPTKHTRRIIIKDCGDAFKYDSCSYSDDYPYWDMDNEYVSKTNIDNHRIQSKIKVHDFKSKMIQPHLIIPYTTTESDIRFTCCNNNNTGFKHGIQFYDHLKATLDSLLEQYNEDQQPKMMTVALHCRLAQPGRVAGLERFIDYVHSLNSYNITSATNTAYDAASYIGNTVSNSFWDLTSTIGITSPSSSTTPTTNATPIFTTKNTAEVNSSVSGTATNGGTAGITATIGNPNFGPTVWVCTREQIADHWINHHYPVGQGKSIQTTEESIESLLMGCEILLNRM